MANHLRASQSTCVEKYYSLVWYILILDIAEILIWQFVLISVFANQALHCKFKNKKEGKVLQIKSAINQFQINFSGEIQTLKRFKFFMQYWYAQAILVSMRPLWWLCCKPVCFVGTVL